MQLSSSHKLVSSKFVLFVIRLNTFLGLVFTHIIQYSPNHLFPKFIFLVDLRIWIPVRRDKINLKQETRDATQIHRYLVECHLWVFLNFLQFKPKFFY